MKRLVIAAFFVFSAAVFAQDAADDFARDTWLKWHSSGTKVQYKHLPDQGVDASPALAVVLLPDNPADKSGSILRKFPVDPGCFYRVKISARALKADPDVKVDISMQALNADGKIVRVIKSLKKTVGTQWQEFSFLGDVPGSAAGLQIVFSAGNTRDNMVIFDDFALEKFDVDQRFADAFDCSIWDSWAAAKTPVKFFHCADDGRGKPGAAGIRLHQVSGKKASGSIIARCGVIPGEEYTLVVYAKSADLSTDATVSVGIQGQDGKNNFLGTGVVGKNISATQCEDEWTRIILMFPVPDKGKWAKCEKVLITMSATSTEPGPVLFDDFMIFNTKSEE